MPPREEPFASAPSQLLESMPLHHVVVCTECLYAIPPSAVSRHLKDIHKIGRARRRQFLDFVASLTLKDPRDVAIPKGDQFPVAILPILDGVQCRFPGCGHLCVTEKRMKAHWISIHQRAGRAESDWHRTPLQTFFRGKNLRYFTGNGRPCAEQVQSEIEANLLGNDLVLTAQSRSGLQAGGVAWNTVEPVGPTSSLVRGHLFSNITQSERFLLHHYEAVTSETIATDHETKRLWRDTVVFIATQYEFLMHGIMAIAALHLAHDELIPHKKRHYLFTASKHQDEAMPAFREAVINVNESNCHAILAFTHLLVFYSFASEQQDERLLLVTENKQDVVPTWFHFIRTGCSMLCSVWEVVETGPCKALTLAWEKPLPDPASNASQEILHQFLRAIPPISADNSWSGEECREYRKAASDLALALVCSKTMSEPCTTWDVIRIWPLELSDVFIRMLASCHPGALLLLVHYALLLEAIEHHWYFEGRAARLIREVVVKMDREWHKYLEAPLQYIKEN